MRLLSCLFTFILLLTGCASTQQSLNVHREYSEEQFTATFDRAFFSKATDGQLDVILITDGPGNAAINQPLAMTRGRSVRQVVHMRVLWQSPRDTRVDNPSANNAVITWHVVASANDRLTYTGAAWARVSVDEEEADLDIRRATIAISSMTGSIDDPLKRATIDGMITARRADATVRSYLDELASLGEPSAATALTGPPARGGPIP